LEILRTSHAADPVLSWSVDCCVAQVETEHVPALHDLRVNRVLRDAKLTVDERQDGYIDCTWCLNERLVECDLLGGVVVVVVSKVRGTCHTIAGKVRLGQSHGIGRSICSVVKRAGRIETILVDPFLVVDFIEDIVNTFGVERHVHRVRGVHTYAFNKVAEGETHRKRADVLEAEHVEVVRQIVLTGKENLRCAHEGLNNVVHVVEKLEAFFERHDVERINRVAAIKNRVECIISSVL